MFVALGIQHAIPVRLPGSTIFSTLSHEQMIFGKKVIVYKMFLFSPQLLSKTFLNLRRTERDMTKNIYWPSCKVPVIFVQY